MIKIPTYVMMMGHINHNATTDNIMAESVQFGSFHTHESFKLFRL